jgi:hypothetical protein
MSGSEYSKYQIVHSPDLEAGASLYRQAIAFAKAAQFEQALASAEAITQHNFMSNEHFKFEALCEIAASCIEHQNLELAITIVVERIEWIEYRDRAFYNLAFCFLELDNIAAATELAAKIESPELKTEVLLEIQKVTT